MMLNRIETVRNKNKKLHYEKSIYNCPAFYLQ